MNIDQSNIFQVINPDYSQSPMTGMTHKHWIDAGKYILSRVFKHIDVNTDYLPFAKITGTEQLYIDTPVWQQQVHKLEGLRRTFSIAAPLIHNNPEIEIQGLKLRDYYCHQLVATCTPGTEHSISLPNRLPDKTYQMTVEFGGLCMLMLRMPDVIWPNLNQSQRDIVAAMISKWAHFRTPANNWRFFNIMMLSFLKTKGYSIDEDLLTLHLDQTMASYAGGGWYLEQHYDYYSVWVYQLYSIIWSRAYGDKYDPERVDLLETRFNDFIKSYPKLFGRDGNIIMWGRSICYRLAAAGCLPLAFLAKQSHDFSGGWSRRLCSGALLQFVTREDFWEKDIPSLGFYGAKKYCLQYYSYPASPYWMFMPFMNLSLPTDSPFWTETEHDGEWNDLGQKTANHFIAGPGIFIANHGKTGTTEIRTAKVNERDPNYNKLTYNSHFPWEADSDSGISAMNYSFQNLEPASYNANHDVIKYATPCHIFHISQQDDILYRQLIMQKQPQYGTGYLIDLADIIMPGGVIRIDRCRLAFEHRLTLGHYGLPHLDGVAPVVEQYQKGNATVITGKVKKRQVALITLNGWDGVDYCTHQDNNAETDASTVLYAYRKRLDSALRMELLISVLLHKLDDTPWTEDELFPIANYSILPYSPSGDILGIELHLKDGRRFTVDFKHPDGNRSY